MVARRRTRSRGCNKTARLELLSNKGKRARVRPAAATRAYAQPGPTNAAHAAVRPRGASVRLATSAAATGVLDDPKILRCCGLAGGGCAWRWFATASKTASSSWKARLCRQGPTVTAMLSSTSSACAKLAPPPGSASALHKAEVRGRVPGDQRQVPSRGPLPRSPRLLALHGAIRRARDAATRADRVCAPRGKLLEAWEYGAQRDLVRASSM